MQHFSGVQLWQKAKYSYQIIRIKNIFFTHRTLTLYYYLPFSVKMSLLWEGFLNTCEATQHLLSMPWPKIWRKIKHSYNGFFVMLSLARWPWKVTRNFGFLTVSSSDIFKVTSRAIKFVCLLFKYVGLFSPFISLSEFFFYKLNAMVMELCRLYESIVHISISTKKHMAFFFGFQNQKLTIFEWREKEFF